MPAPHAGAWVTIVRNLARDERAAPEQVSGSCSLCTHADERGRFRFQGLGPGLGWTLIAN